MKTSQALITCFIVAFSVIAGLVFGAYRIGVYLPHLHGLEAPPLRLDNEQAAKVRVTSLSITPEYRKTLPQSASFDQKFFTHGTGAAVWCIFRNYINDAISISAPTVEFQPLEVLRNRSDPFANKALFLETGGEVYDDSFMDRYKNARPFEPVYENRCHVLKNETVRLSPTKVRQELIVQSSYYKLNKKLVPFKSRFEITYQNELDSRRTSVRIVQSQFDLNDQLWKRLQLDGELLVGG